MLHRSLADASTWKRMKMYSFLLPKRKPCTKCDCYEFLSSSNFHAAGTSIQNFFSKKFFLELLHWGGSDGRTGAHSENFYSENCAKSRKSLYTVQSFFKKGNCFIFPVGIAIFCWWYELARICCSAILLSSISWPDARSGWCMPRLSRPRVSAVFWMITCAAWFG